MLPSPVLAGGKPIAWRWTPRTAPTFTPTVGVAAVVEPLCEDAVVFDHLAVDAIAVSTHVASGELQAGVPVAETDIELSRTWVVDPDADGDDTAGNAVRTSGTMLPSHRIRQQPTGSASCQATR
jgi:hypothetical protein